MKTCPQFYLDVCKYRIKGAIKKATKGRLCKVRTYSYEKIWKYILNRTDSDSKFLPGAFVKCDVTPRRQDRAVIFKGASPEKFEKFLGNYLHRKNGQFEFLFLTAWNEWGEGMYLEPDEKDKYGYLEGVRNAINQVNTII
jgi:hypothetical protein